MQCAEVAIETMNWIQLAEDKDQWRAFGNMTLNLRVS